MILCRSALKLIVVCLCLWVARPYPVFGTEYYAAVNGLTSNAGTSPTSPWPLQYALNQLAAGVELILLPGVYTGPFQVYGVNGTAASPITIKSQVKWGAVIANSPSLGIAACSMSGYQASYIVFDGLCLSNNATDGIGGWRNCVIRNCWSIRNGMQGVNLSSPTSAYNRVEYCLLENNGWADPLGDHYHGLYFCGQGNVIRGNVVRCNTGFGIHLFTEDPGVWNTQNSVYNNLTYGHNHNYGVALWNANWLNGGSLPGTNYLVNNTILDGVQVMWGTVAIMNNIILPSPINSTLPLVSDPTRPAVIVADYNLSTVALSPWRSHDKIAACIGCVNPANHLYWLQATSPARGMANPYAVPSVDFFARPQTSTSDVGAFQYDPVLATDTRNLTGPSPLPDYWQYP